jgi:hypothetical protein
MKENLAKIHAIAEELFLSKTEVKLQSNNTRLLLRLISQYKNVPPTTPLWLLRDFCNKTNDLLPYPYFNWEAADIGIKANNKVLEISFPLDNFKSLSNE